MKRTKRVLVLYYSLTGQTARVIRAITEAFRAAGHHVDVHRIHPVRPWQLPFGKTGFLLLWIRMLAGAHITQPIEWIPLTRGRYDCIILGCQPWNLQPSIPVLSFLESDMANVFQGTPVVMVMTCRSCWENAYKKVAAAVTQRGGFIVDALIIRDQAGPVASLATTLYRVWENHPPPPHHWVARLPAFGIGDHALPVARRYGHTLARDLLEGRLETQHGCRIVNYPY